jgi:ABC-2 type transport system permease protein
MIRRIVAILKKETTQIWRDKVTLAISIAIPLTLLLLFGYSIKMNVRDIPTAVADQSRDDISREYINSLVNSQYSKLSNISPIRSRKKCHR